MRALTGPDASSRARASVRFLNLCGSGGESSVVSSRRWQRSFHLQSDVAAVLSRLSLARGSSPSYLFPETRRPSAHETLPPGHRCEYRCDPVMVLKSAQHSAEFAMDCSDIRVWDHSRIHKDTPALPFCHLALMAKKPRDSAYPISLRTAGDRLRARRFDLGLSQKHVAAILGVTVDTVCYWENGRVQPSTRLIPRLLLFLEEGTMTEACNLNAPSIRSKSDHTQARKCGGGGPEA